MVVSAGAAVPRRAADRQAVGSLPQVVSIFENEAGWYNNASFLLPLVATIVIGVAGLATRQGEILGFDAFLGAVTLLMIPVVLVTWNQTPTAVVLTATMIVSMHDGRLLKSLSWSEVTSVRERETQGNRRWEIAAASGERILLDGELERLPVLVQLAQELARGGARAEA